MHIEGPDVIRIVNCVRIWLAALRPIVQLGAHLTVPTTIQIVQEHAHSFRFNYRFTTYFQTIPAQIFRI